MPPGGGPLRGVRVDSPTCARPCPGPIRQVFGPWRRSHSRRRGRRPGHVPVARFHAIEGRLQPRCGRARRHQRNAEHDGRHPERGRGASTRQRQKSEYRPTRVGPRRCVGETEPGRGSRVPRIPQISGVSSIAFPRQPYRTAHRSSSRGRGARASPSSLQSPGRLNRRGAGRRPGAGRCAHEEQKQAHSHVRDWIEG